MPDDEGNEVEAGAGDMKKVVGVALLALLLGGAGGVAGTLYMPSADAATETDDAKTDGADGDVGPGLRVVIPLEAFTVNLRGSSGGRVLRLEVQVEVESEDEMAILDGTPAMQDAIISLASDYSFAELEGIDGKMHFRDELLGRLNRVLDGPRVQRVYFTEFVVH